MARPAPRLVYVGSLESRLDVDQIRSLAAAFPGGSINLVGSLIEPAHFAPLQEIANVHFQPRVSREEVPGVIAGADLGLIPHVRTRFTEAISRPLKLYEYLAAGKPVVATVTSPGIHGLSERVLTVLPDGDMVPAARRALALEPQPEAARREFIAEHAWARRFDTLLELALAAD
jgi:glycosyltransferase involved in cell wall biosynthesis